MAVGALSATAGRRWVVRRWAGVQQGGPTAAPTPRTPPPVGGSSDGRRREAIDLGPVTRKAIGTAGRVGAVAVRQGARRLERAVAGGRADARSRERQLRERWLAPSTRRAAR